MSNSATLHILPGNRSFYFVLEVDSDLVDVGTGIANPFEVEFTGPAFPSGQSYGSLGFGVVDLSGYGAPGEGAYTTRYRINYSGTWGSWITGPSVATDAMAPSYLYAKFPQGITPPPPAYYGQTLQVTAESPGQVEFTCSVGVHQSDIDANAVDYTYEWYTEDSPGSGTFSLDSGSTTNVHTFTGLTPGSSYNFRVRIKNPYTPNDFSIVPLTSALYNFSYSAPSGLTLTPPTADLDYTAQSGLSVALDITPDGGTWSASSDADWLVLDPGSEAGMGDQDLGYSVALNDTDDERVGTITAVADLDGASDTHVVTQAPCEARTVAFFFVHGAPTPSRSRRQGGFQFVQPAPATVWTIPHDLGHLPSVVAIDGSGNQLMGAISYPDLNTVVITFGSARSGSASLR